MVTKALAHRESASISAVHRAAKLLKAVAALPPQERTLTALANYCEINVSSAHHLLATLLKEGLLARDVSRRYYFGPTLTALSEIALREKRPAPALVAELHHLGDLTGEHAYLSGWVLGQIQVLAEVSGTHAVSVAGLRLGFDGYEYARASGQMLLALLDHDALDDYLSITRLEPLTPETISDEASLRRELSLIREQGFVVEKGQFAQGVACCAAPIVRDGLVLAALAISTPIERFLANEDKLIAAVRECAGRASAVIAGDEAGPTDHEGSAQPRGAGRPHS